MDGKKHCRLRSGPQLFRTCAPELRRLKFIYLQLPRREAAFSSFHTRLTFGRELLSPFCGRGIRRESCCLPSRACKGTPGRADCVAHLSQPRLQSRRRPAPHAHAQPLLWHAPRALWRRPRGLARLIARETGSWPREWRGPRRQERPARPPAAEERPSRLPVGRQEARVVVLSPAPRAGVRSGNASTRDKGGVGAPLGRGC